jgi:hypothetical protein
MAKVIEQTIQIKFSKIVKDTYDSNEVLTDDQIMILCDAIPALCDEALSDSTIIVEID